MIGEDSESESRKGPITIMVSGVGFVFNCGGIRRHLHCDANRVARPPPAVQRGQARAPVQHAAGHVVANLALAVVALGLGSCQIAAFFDDEVNALTGIDGEEETTLYMSAVGPVP